jgi:hypothetical protein
LHPKNVFLVEVLKSIKENGNDEGSMAKVSVKQMEKSRFGFATHPGG